MIRRYPSPSKCELDFACSIGEDLHGRGKDKL